MSSGSGISLQPTDAHHPLQALYEAHHGWLVARLRRKLLIRQALFVNLARAEVSKPLDGLKLNGIGTLQ